MQLAKTAQGKVRLWSVKTGEEIERWPVDAQGMVASGEYSPTPVEVKRKKGDGDTATEGEALGAGALTFDPVKTPSMDSVAGATSPLVPAEPAEAVLGASSEVTALPPVETVNPAPPGGELPRTTALGQPAVHARERGPAQRDQQPVRTTRGKGK
jgi:hypothetical protein